MWDNVKSRTLFFFQNRMPLALDLPSRASLSKPSQILDEQASQDEVPSVQ